MTDRELFNAIMFYEDFDRLPVWYTGEWNETAAEWAEQGLPLDANRRDHFDALGFPWSIPTHLRRKRIGTIDAGYRFGAGSPVDLYGNSQGADEDNGLRGMNMLFPRFPEDTIEETKEHRVFRQEDGVIVKQLKHITSMPHPVEHVFRDASGWDEYKQRLQPDPGRHPEDLDQILAQMQDADEPLRIRTGSLVGAIRNWMGVENFSYLHHDDPDLIGEMVDTIADLVCWEIDQLLPKIRVDIAWFWEDICFNTGPLVSPWAFEKYVVPGYQKITSKLSAYGVKLVGVDSDGLIDALIPGWLEGGVNVFYPVEIVHEDLDPIALRKRYGRELRIIGAINRKKFIDGKAAIDAEIKRRLPLMQDGGYIPSTDHEVLPGTPLANYQYYLDRIRALRF